MKILKKELRRGIIKLQAETPEDLWYLSQIIDTGDQVRGVAERKIQLGEEEEKSRIIKKKITVQIEVEKVTYDNQLRLLGIILEAPEDVPRGSHQSITIKEHDMLTIIKQQWLSFQLDKLKESQQPHTNILIVVFDREEALFGTLTPRGVTVLATKKGEVAKKQMETNHTNFFKEIAQELARLRKRLHPDQVIIASPSFWKDYLLKEVEDAQHLVQASCSTVSEQALHEILKRPELKQALDTVRESQEARWVEEVLKAIAQDIAFYGFEEAKQNIEVGNVRTLLVSEVLIKKMKEDQTYPQLETLMKQAERVKGRLILVHKNKQLDGLGGIAGIQRWKQHQNSTSLK